MTVFNLKTYKFEVYKNQDKFLAIQIDIERSDLQEVIHYINKGRNTEIIALNNEDDTDLEKSLELFSRESKLFCVYLDFYIYDNTQSMIDILKTL